VRLNVKEGVTIMYELKIGWNTYLFDKASDAAKVLEILDSVPCVDGVWDTTTQSTLWYYKESPLTITQSKVTSKNVYKSYETAKAEVDLRLAEQEARVAADVQQAAEAANGAMQFDGE